LLPENKAARMTDHSMTVLTSRRRKIFAFDAGATAGAASGAAGLACDSLFTISAGSRYASES